MSCRSCRRPFPSEIAAMMMANLLVAAAERNEANSSRPEICVAQQTDLPGKFCIDVDFPTEDQAIRNKYLCRFEIDETTGEIAFRPNGMMPREAAELHPYNAVWEIQQRMLEIIRTH